MRVGRIKVVTGMVTGLLALGVVNAPTSSAASWACSAGKSCYYDGDYGTTLFWVAPSCGFHDLGRMNPRGNDRMNSVYNRGNGNVHLYNWTGSKWDYLLTVPVGDKTTLNSTMDNIVDAVRIDC